MGRLRAPLRGRGAECAVIDRLLDAARAGRSGALVIHGEPGIGKTALLEYATEDASDFRVLRAAGVESEMELPFAGLHQLCGSLLDGIGGLPEPQRDALRVAFGIRSGAPADRFIVGLASLSLLSEAAAERPVLCLIDDAHWLDEESALTTAFVARRLMAESVAMLFVTREPEDTFRALPELGLAGLGPEDSRALLASSILGVVDERVRERVVAETRGNPLALIALPHGVSPAELAGGFGVADGASLTGLIEQSFLRRLDSLPADTNRLLLTAAAEPLGDPVLLQAATGRLGLDPDAIEPARTAGLVEIGAMVRFRHPLVRSAVYRAASVPDRRAAHRALAESLDPEDEPDRHAWHRAQAAGAPDEEVAAELERSAERARGRGGLAAMAGFMERAAELTPDPGRRGTRLVAAARAKLEAGAPDAAQELLAGAQRTPLSDLDRARLGRLRGQIAFGKSRGNDVPPLLLEAARLFAREDAAAARETYVEAFGAEIFAGREGRGRGTAELAEAARLAPPAMPAARSIDLLLDGLAERFGDPNDATPALDRALRAFTEEARGETDDPKWLWMACPVTPEPLAPELWDEESWRVLAERAVNVARDFGALAVLPIALTYLAGFRVHAGEFEEAAALIEEADEIAAASGSPPLPYTSLLLVAWRGDEAKALPVIEAGLRSARSRGEGRAVGLAEYATAVLFNGLGRYAEAFAAAERACEYEDLGFYGWGLVELIEAGVRGGALEPAAAAMLELDARARAAGTDWALGVRAGSEALLRDGGDAEGLYREAIDHLARSGIVVHRARAQLVFGEWLRRENRRVEARDQLRAALQAFESMGAEAFADRARRELRATGETARRRTAETRDELTAQEAQIARLARDGLSNPEIGAQLFISPRTVQYHLGKVFAKLGIRSRNQLVAVSDDRIGAAHSSGSRSTR